MRGQLANNLGGYFKPTAKMTYAIQGFPGISIKVADVVPLNMRIKGQKTNLATVKTQRLAVKDSTPLLEQVSPTPTHSCKALKRLERRDDEDKTMCCPTLLELEWRLLCSWTLF
jgi:hypothetical protein